MAGNDVTASVRGIDDWRIEVALQASYGIEATLAGEEPFDLHDVEYKYGA